MAGEIQLNSTTLATESSGSITAELDTIRPNTTNGSLTLQGDNSGTGVSGITIDSSGNATFAQTISGGTIGSSVVFPAGCIIKTTIYNYAPNAIKNLYTGTNTDTLYYNSDLDTSVTMTNGNRLLVTIYGGRVTVGTAGADAFVFSVEIGGTDYFAGVTYLNDSPLHISVGSDAIAATSATIKIGGFARYDSRTPTLDLRNSSSGAGGGTGALGSPLRYIIQEVQV